jgi:hypothetical protein
MQFWVGFRPKWANVLAAQAFTVTWRPHRSMDWAPFRIWAGPELDSGLGQIYVLGQFFNEIR